MNKAEKTALISAALASVLANALITVALLVRSLSMLAGGVISVARALTAMMLFSGMRLSRRHPDEFPTGLYKLENLAATVVGVIILAGAYALARVSVHAIANQSNLVEFDSAWQALLPMLVSMALALFMAWYKVKVGREEGSPALAADARFSLVDAAGLGIICVGITLEAEGVKSADAWAALAVVAIAAWVGLTVILDGTRVLLDASVERDVLEQVRAIAQADRRVRGVLDVEGRNSGRYRFINLDVELDTFDLREAEGISQGLKERIREEVSNVDQVTVDFSAGGEQKALCAVPLEAGGRAVHDGFGTASRVALLDLEKGREGAAVREVVDNPFLREEEAPGVRLAVFLAMQGVGAVLLRGPLEDRGARDVLEAYEVRILEEPDVRDLEGARRRLAALPGAGGGS
jgi:cation diffusion facilitator family transporter